MAGSGFKFIRVQLINIRVADIQFSLIMAIMFTVMNRVQLHISVKTTEMPMFTSWKSKKLSGKIESEI